MMHRSAKKLDHAIELAIVLDDERERRQAIGLLREFSRRLAREQGTESEWARKQLHIINHAAKTILVTRNPSRGGGVRNPVASMTDKILAN